jgi:hypothetical protein
MKPCVPVYCAFAVCAFLCGCETVGAFGTGRITKSDVAYITHAGTLGTRTAPVDVTTAEADEDYDAPEGRRTNASQKAAKADAWLEENLW